MGKPTINREAGNKEAWICLCGNEPHEDGFYPCNKNGDEIEPTTGSDWDDLYVCRKCGRIINQNNLEIVGQNMHPVFLER